MAFFLKTRRGSLRHTSESPSNENHAESPAMTLRPTSAERIEDYLRFRSQFPNLHPHYTVPTPRRWSHHSLGSGFESYAGSSNIQVPADSSNNEGPANSSNVQGSANSSNTQWPADSSSNQVRPESPDPGPVDEGSSSAESSQSILVVDDGCELVPLQSHLGNVTSHMRMSNFMRACRSCERSLQDKIDELPNSKITLEHVENAELCSVCMENFNLDEEVKKLSCSHLFHGDCISPWLKKRQTCPICRKVAVSAGARAKVRLHRFQPYHRRRQSTHMLFEPPHWLL